MKQPSILILLLVLSSCGFASLGWAHPAHCFDQRRPTPRILVSGLLPSLEPIGVVCEEDDTATVTNSSPVVEPKVKGLEWLSSSPSSSSNKAPEPQKALQQTP